MTTVETTTKDRTTQVDWLRARAEMAFSEARVTQEEATKDYGWPLSEYVDALLAVACSGKMPEWFTAHDRDLLREMIEEKCNDD